MSITALLMRASAARIARRESFRRVAMLAAIGWVLAMSSVALAKKAPRHYVALGDSVAAGIGAGSPEPPRGDCTGAQNSAHAYPRRVASALGARLDFAAVCGANTSAVRRQLGALKKLTNLVTVQVGANEGGFARILGEDCIKTLAKSCVPRVQKVESFFRTELPGRLDRLYREIRKKAPKAKVIVVGYPHLVGRSGCAGTLMIKDDERNAIIAATNTLAGTLSAVARKHKFQYVYPRASFKGHEVCSNDEWIHGISRPLVESFHPNKKGQEALGWLVWQLVKPKK